MEELIFGILRYSGSPRKRTPSGSREKGVHNCSWPLSGMQKYTRVCMGVEKNGVFCEGGPK